MAAATCGHYRQNGTLKWSITADGMYSKIRVEWAGDHFGLGLTWIDPLFIFRSQWLLDLKFVPLVTLLSAVLTLTISTLSPASATKSTKSTPSPFAATKSSVCRKSCRGGSGMTTVDSIANTVDYVAGDKSTMSKSILLLLCTRHWFCCDKINITAYRP